MLLTQNQVVDLFHYDATTGAFVWKHRSNVPQWWNTRYAGKVAGNPDAYGYLTLCINGRFYKAHRIAWLYVTGDLPDVEIDHRDGVRTNNTFANLRLANDQQNAANAGRRSDNKSGIKGVSWHKRLKKYQAQININGRRKSLGYYDSADVAGRVYLAKAIEVFGEFARVEGA